MKPKDMDFMAIMDGNEIFCDDTVEPKDGDKQEEREKKASQGSR